MWFIWRRWGVKDETDYGWRIKRVIIVSVKDGKKVIGDRYSGFTKIVFLRMGNPDNSS